MKMFRKICSMIVLGALFLGNQFAAAEEKLAEEKNLGTVGYFCHVRYNPVSGVYGDHGYLMTILWSQKNCGGSYVGHRYFCSTNATSNICPSSASYHYDDHQILALFSSIQQYVISGNRVIVQGDTGGYSCNHQSCGALVDFYSN